MRNFARPPGVLPGMRFLLLVGMVLAVTLPRPAEACSCVERTFAAHAKAERRVFLARAGKPVVTGDARKQTFTILATFKGPVAAQFVLDRPATPPCAMDYSDGEIAILFTSGGDLDPCHGNARLAEHLEHVPSIVAATGTRTKRLRDAAGLEAAVRAVIVPYLHARPRIPVVYGPLAGKTFTIDTTRFAVAKAATKHAVIIDHALAAGDIGYVSGRYPREGLRFAVLVLRARDGSWSVLGADAAET